MSSWYVSYLVAQERIRDGLAEADRDHLARALAGHRSTAAAREARAGVRVRAGVRRWTVRLSRLAVTVSLEPAAGREARS